MGDFSNWPVSLLGEWGQVAKRNRITDESAEITMGCPCWPFAPNDRSDKIQTDRLITFSYYSFHDV
jgi:hypothetical protein